MEKAIVASGGEGFRPLVEGLSDQKIPIELEGDEA